MGDIADMMLEGDMCQFCGEWLGDGDGFPRSCPSCGDDDEEVKPVKVRQFDAPFYAIKGQADFENFSKFISTALYDRYERTLDKFKNPLFRLNLGSARAATVCCRNKNFLQNVEAVLAQHKGESHGK